MASTPIYNWPTPDNTGLVKNGALDMRNLGNAIDTTMATMTPKSLVDAKGDLIAATANDTPARLAVGANGETLVADSSTSTGLRYQVPVNSNPVLNSAFQVFQRGTATAISTPAYVADRWQGGRAANATGTTFSQQATNDSTNLPFIQYCLRVQRDSGNTGTGASYLVQSFETINSIPYAGKSVTYSFYARKGANYSATSSGLGVIVAQGTGTDQNLLTVGYTGGTNLISNTVTLTSTWQRFTLTGSVASTTKELGLMFTFDPTGTAGANDYYEVTGIQLEVGSVATPFKTYAGTIQGELAACQRYFYKKSADSSNAYAYFAQGTITSTTNLRALLEFPVAMRTSPTVTKSGNMNISTAGVAVTSVTIDGNTANGDSSGTKVAQSLIFAAATGLVLGQSGYVFANNDTTANLSFSAEL